MALGAAAAAGCPAPPRSCLPALRGDGIQSWFGVEAREGASNCHPRPATAALAEVKLTCQGALQKHPFCQGRFVTGHPGQRERHPLGKLL